MKKLPLPFQHQMQTLLLDEYDHFTNALEAAPPTSIRWNHQKNKPLLPTSHPVKWNPHGVYLTQRPVFTLDPSFHTGAYYVQEASSMCLSAVMEQIIFNQQPLKVLDLCAAPGGKTTSLLSVLPKGSLMVCNEVIKSRYQVLHENILKWGYPNVISTNHDPKDFEGLTDFFDVVLVDAPCSGEGLFRKDPNAVAHWSEELVETCAARQKRILADAQKLVKPNGYLLYSTCTYNDKENLENVVWLEEQFNLKAQALRLPSDWNICEKNKYSSWGYQFFPHLLEGEGFFISCLKKSSSGNGVHSAKNPAFKHLLPLDKKQHGLVHAWVNQFEQFQYYQTENNRVFAIPETLVSQYAFIAQRLNRHAFAFEIGTIKGKDLIPSHALALSIHQAQQLPTLTLDKENALRFLKKETFDSPTSEEGWRLIQYEGNGLGWVKALHHRVNNYLPKDWRIRMEIPENE